MSSTPSAERARSSPPNGPCSAARDRDDCTRSRRPWAFRARPACARRTWSRRSSPPPPSAMASPSRRATGPRRRPPAARPNRRRWTAPEAGTRDVRRRRRDRPGQASRREARPRPTEPGRAHRGPGESDAAPAVERQRFSLGPDDRSRTKPSPRRHRPRLGLTAPPRTPSPGGSGAALRSTGSANTVPASAGSTVDDRGFGEGRSRRRRRRGRDRPGYEGAEAPRDQGPRDRRDPGPRDQQTSGSRGSGRDPGPRDQQNQREPRAARAA